MNSTCRLVLCLVLLAQAASTLAEGAAYEQETPVADVPDAPADYERHPPRSKPFPMPPMLNLLAPQSICDFLTYIQQVNQAFINNQIKTLNEIWSARG